MTKDEALRLALEALKTCEVAWPGTRFKSKYFAEDEVKAAITAIKAALSGEAQTRSVVKDEPFGYFRYDLRLDAWVQSRDSNQGAAFYTTPPQRKPLTDDAIWNSDSIMEANSGYGASFETLREIVRAIEAAHGITGDNNG